MMHRLCSLLADPGLHFLVIVLFLIGLEIGSNGPADSHPGAALARCIRCETYHLPERHCACSIPNDLAQVKH